MAKMKYDVCLPSSEVQDKPLKCIYFAEPEPFEEVDQFISSIRSSTSS